MQLIVLVPDDAQPMFDWEYELTYGTASSTLVRTEKRKKKSAQPSTPSKTCRQKWNGMSTPGVDIGQLFCLKCCLKKKKKGWVISSWCRPRRWPSLYLLLLRFPCRGVRIQMSAVVQHVAVPRLTGCSGLDWWAGEMKTISGEHPQLLFSLIMPLTHKDDFKSLIPP